MTATDCEFCHEDFCIAKEVLGKDFVCSGMKETNVLLIKCTLSNDDLVDGGMREYVRAYYQRKKTNKQRSRRWHIKK